MIVTALLVRWTEGWHEVINAAGIAATGRKEGMLGLGAVTSLTEVETVTKEQLNYFADPRTEIGADVAPIGTADTPFVAYRTGDSIVVPDLPGRPASAQRVQAITATMNDDGRVTYAVELNDVLLDERERFAETLTKMANGTLGGWSKVGQPVSGIGAPSEKATASGWELGTAPFTDERWASNYSTSWTCDGNFHPTTITVDGNHLGGNPVRVALCYQGEGPTPIGPVIVFEGIPVTGNFPPDVNLGPGSDYFFYVQEWDEGRGAPNIENLRISVPFSGDHANVTLRFYPPT